MKQQYGKYLKRALEAHGSKFPSRESMSRFKILNEHGKYCKARGMHCWGTSYASSLCPGDMMPMVFILAWKSVSVDQKMCKKENHTKKMMMERLKDTAQNRTGSLFCKI